METVQNVCSHCSHHVHKESSLLEESGGRICYECCAILDKEYMDLNGKIILYISPSENNDNFWVCNYPGTLVYEVNKIKTTTSGRTDIWFKDHNGVTWWGVNFKKNLQEVCCKRLRSSMN